MAQESKIIEKKLRYIGESFPGSEWHEFLKNSNVNLYTSRKDRLWYSMTGKGFVIWISSFYPTKENNRTVWFSDIEINKNSPTIGFENLDDFLHGAVAQFEKMKLVE